MAIIYGDKNTDKNDSLVGTTGPDEIYGLTGNDTITGGFGDSLFGGVGDDLLIGVGGEALFRGDAGVDKIYMNDGYGDSKPVFESLILDSTSSIEKIEFFGRIYGTSGDNKFDLSGTTEIFNYGYTIEGEADAYIYGIVLGAGQDSFIGGADDDAVFGDIGDDRLEGGAGDDELVGGVGADWISGGSGDDALYAEHQHNVSTLPPPGSEPSVDVLDGGAGDDRIYSSIISGSVSISGGDGTDTLVVAGGKYIEYEHFDISGTSIEILEADQNKVFNYNQFPIFGTDKDNVFDVSYLMETDCSFDLAAGDDVFSGSDDGDIVVGGLGGDSISGGDGGDLFFGRRGSDVLKGFLGGDDLQGHGGNDLLNGGAGADQLSGGAGRDKLIGGDGEDSFFFEGSLKSVDVIKDFSTKFDTIELDRHVFGALKGGVLDKDAFVVGAEARDKQDRIVYDDETGSLWFDRDGTGDGKAIKFATVDEGLKLGHRDFDLIYAF